MKNEANQQILVTRTSMPPLEEYVDEIRDMWDMQMAQTNGHFCGAKRPQGASLWPRGAAERPCLSDL